jgi:hypothetical protein
MPINIKRIGIGETEHDEKNRKTLCYIYAVIIILLSLFSIETLPMANAVNPTEDDNAWKKDGPTSAAKGGQVTCATSPIVPASRLTRTSRPQGATTNPSGSTIRAAPLLLAGTRKRLQVTLQPF